MAYHVCPDCGLGHDHVVPQVNPEVEIARINAENALKIAQLNARADRHIAEVQAESDVDIAEVTADAIVEAVTPPEVEEAPAEEADPEPGIAPSAIVVDTDVEPDVPAPPAAHEEEHHEEPRKKSGRGLGMWGA
jgi:hypothetical protein